MKASKKVARQMAAIHLKVKVPHVKKIGMPKGTPMVRGQGPKRKP